MHECKGIFSAVCKAKDSRPPRLHVVLQAEAVGVFIAVRTYHRKMHNPNPRTPFLYILPVKVAPVRQTMTSTACDVLDARAMRQGRWS